jgi:hypothetical protein
MKHHILTAKTMVLLLGLSTAFGCGISGPALRATQQVVVRPTVVEEARQTAEAHIETAVPATLTAIATTQTVALLSFHGRYVTATGAGGGWLIKQEPALSDCGWFTLHHLENGKVTLMTCYDRYVTAPKTGATRQDWMLWQDSELGDCGQFLLHDLKRDGVAFETCAGRFVTPGDDGWDPGLEWSVVGETYRMEAWEKFIMLRQP